MNPHALRWRPFRIAALLLLSLLLWFVPLPATQDPDYHHFADTRVVAGVPNFWNVASNGGFLLVGLTGLVLITRPRSQLFISRSEAPAAICFALGNVAVAFGSAWYHLRPTDASLVWDRLPMTLAFAGFVTLVISERLGSRVGTFALLPLIAFGVWTVEHWRVTGDMRPYSYFQLLAAAGTLLMTLLFPALYNRAADLGWALLAYVAAKVFELGDRTLFDMTHGFVSGHTLKHLAAALAAFFIVRMLILRTPLHLATSPLKG
jgi:hypothetical protein